VRIDSARRPTLATIAAPTIMVGHGRVKPSDCFIVKARMTSRTPAATR
jgi:hypothetical protein